MQSNHSISETHFWKKRPPEVNSAIKEVFEDLAIKPDSEWTMFNGNTEYLLANVKEQVLIKTMIENNYKQHNQKEFWILDIGAGDFSWGKALADYLNQELTIDEIVVNIINVRGEKNTKEEIFTDGKCKMYNLGQFKIEEMITAFEDRNLHLIHQVDFMTSHACLQHLVDATGTFAQAYELLKPITGYFSFNDFNLFIQYEENQQPQFNLKHTMRMLIEADLVFLMAMKGDSNYPTQYVIKKKNTDPCMINLEYSHVSFDASTRGRSNHTVVYTHPNETTGLSNIHFDYSYASQKQRMQGDKSLYEYFCQEKLLFEPNYIWKSTYKNKMDRTEKFPLHEAVKEGNIEKVKLYLSEGVNINESDYDAKTPLHLAIEGNYYKIFQLLLTHKPRLDIFNIYKLNWVHRERRDILNEAIYHDKKGDYIRLLLAADDTIVNPGERFCGDKSPLEFAKEHDNPIACELIENTIKLSTHRDSFYRQPTYYEMHLEQKRIQREKADKEDKCTIS